jgi:ubiquinone/menaquinone biosynthesis C-methylase UbiE
MTAAFDHIAIDYDSNFTYSETGKAARKIVLDYLEKNVLKDGPLKILELNCGTGEDAIWLSKRGNEVYATDASSEMIRVAKEKSSNFNIRGLTFCQLDFSELPPDWMTGNFDLVFSNFGGLNCLDENRMKNLFEAVNMILKPGGRFIGVIMPRYCLWEIFYFSLKGKWKKALRRNKKGPAKVWLGGIYIDTWFYSPRKIKNLSAYYRIKAIRPVGIILPSSFMEGFFKKRIFLMKMLYRAEKAFASITALAGLSDHFLFDLENDLSR